MRGILKLTWVELKLFIRDPMAAFFSLVFPLMLLFIFGLIYGNKPSIFFGGVGYIDTAVPSFTAMIIATSGLLGLSIQMATYRETGILRRLRVTPVRPETILTAQVLISFLTNVLGMVLLVVAAKAVYQMRFTGNVFQVIAGFTLSSFSFFALGFVLAAVLPTARSAQIVAMILFYPMLFFSGAAIPREILSGSIQKFTQIFPLTHVVNLLRGLWIGHSLGDHMKEIVILLSVLLGGVIVSSRTFKWE